MIEVKVSQEGQDDLLSAIKRLEREMNGSLIQIVGILNAHSSDIGMLRQDINERLKRIEQEIRALRAQQGGEEPIAR